METFKRTVGSFFTKGFRRSLLLATYDDSFAVQDEHMQDVLEGLLGCHRDITVAEAIDAIPQRLRENWTWRVVLKVQLVLLYVATSQQTSTSWLKEVLGPDLDILVTCQRFREGEGTDPEAEAHAAVVRKLAQFVELYIREMFRPNSVVAKNLRIGPSMFRDREDDDLFQELRRVDTILKACLQTFVQDTKVVSPQGFCELTACCVRMVFKEAIRLYGILGAAGMELLERVDDLCYGDNVEAYLCLRSYCTSTASMIVFCEFVRTLPGIVQENIPTLSMPAASVLVDLAAKAKREKPGFDLPPLPSEVSGECAATSTRRARRNESRNDSTKSSDVDDANHKGAGGCKDGDKSRSREKRERRRHRRHRRSRSSESSSSDSSGTESSGSRRRRRRRRRKDRDKDDDITLQRQNGPSPTTAPPPPPPPPAPPSSNTVFSASRGPKSWSWLDEDLEDTQSPQSPFASSSPSTELHSSSGPIAESGFNTRPAATAAAGGGSLLDVDDPLAAAFQGLSLNVKAAAKHAVSPPSEEGIFDASGGAPDAKGGQEESQTPLTPQKPGSAEDLLEELMSTSPIARSSDAERRREKKRKERKREKEKKRREDSKTVADAGDVSVSLIDTL